MLWCSSGGSKPIDVHIDLKNKEMQCISGKLKDNLKPQFQNQLCFHRLGRSGKQLRDVCTVAAGSQKAFFGCMWRQQTGETRRLPSRRDPPPPQGHMSHTHSFLIKRTWASNQTSQRIQGHVTYITGGLSIVPEEERTENQRQLAAPSFHSICFCFWRMLRS